MINYLEEHEMNCPSCGNGNLEYAYLDELFPCKTCNHCNGNWLLLEDYLRWKETRPIKLKDEGQIDVELSETKKALICPVSGSLMLKYRISKDTEHKLDLSPAVNGIWLDKGEWALLKKEGLADKLNAIFTAPWQRKIRSEASADVFEQLYLEKFGETDYKKVKEIRDWLISHPHSDSLRAFLISDNPWSATK